MAKVAIIGAGLIGRAWSIVFARGGYEVRMWDPVSGATNSARDFAAARLPELHQAGLLMRGETPKDVLPRLQPAATLQDAVRDAVFVQESGPERVEDKRDLFARLDEAAAPETILASSTSAIPASAFTESLKHRTR
jgi:3-hydroxyacyl-CoA dehydrogenase